MFMESKVMSAHDEKTVVKIPAGKSREWNFHPELPIAMSPVFDIPPKPRAAFDWLIGTWLKLTPPVSHLLFALITVTFFLPAFSDMQGVSIDWMIQIAAIYFGAVILLGTILHLYLYVFAGQKTRQKFDVRPMEKSSRFTFGDQVWDNVFWTLVSAVVCLSGWSILYFFLASNGWVPTLNGFSASPVWFILFFFVLRFWQSFHFYWVHRLIHIPWLFKNVHHLHHRNVNVGPWSGLAMHPVESFCYFSSILIHFVLPSDPLHVIFHMYSLSLGALFSHAGFDKLFVKDKQAIKAGSFHHQLHHRYFECNYGSEEIPLDRWFGSFHDGTPEATKRIRARKKLIFAPK
ncbi:sterol desaturase family protein [uncultured Ruegeria sp.]|uniref:sterol desaturase family protein n=2 Tax=uncultured Ruegeria sp. TaxID=259304 RepID=UPI00262DE16C|nr:sterol desaturase family protein [uncultured Ruegeria sp.]